MAYAPAPDGDTPALEAIGAAAGTAPTALPPVHRAPVPAALPDPLAEQRGAGRSGPGRDRASREKQCLATAIYFEARGEPQKGQAAVAQVILNRVKSPHYPDSVCAVVYQNDHLPHRCQFSFACDGKPEQVTEKHAWVQARVIADEVTAGRRAVKAVGSATHYHADYVDPYWAPSLQRLAQVGAHIFYRS